MEREFKILPADEPKSERDPSMPEFHFTEDEKAEMRKKGMTDEQIAERERGVTQRLSRAKLAEELKGLGVLGELEEEEEEAQAELEEEEEE
jgi:hypothetical protein